MIMNFSRNDLEIIESSSVPSNVSLSVVINLLLDEYGERGIAVLESNLPYEDIVTVDVYNQYKTQCITEVVSILELMGSYSDELGLGLSFDDLNDSIEKAFNDKSYIINFDASSLDNFVVWIQNFLNVSIGLERSKESEKKGLNTKPSKVTVDSNVFDLIHDLVKEDYSREDYEYINNQVASRLHNLFSDKFIFEIERLVQYDYVTNEIINNLSSCRDDVIILSYFNLKCHIFESVIDSFQLPLPTSEDGFRYLPKPSNLVNILEDLSDKGVITTMKFDDKYFERDCKISIDFEGKALGDFVIVENKSTSLKLKRLSNDKGLFYYLPICFLVDGIVDVRVK